MATQKYELGTITTLMDTELNALALNSGNIAVVGKVFDNSLTANLYFWGDFELNVTFGTAPTANSLIDLFIIPTIDGTNYSDTTVGVNGFAAGSAYRGSFQVRAVTTIQRMSIVGVILPPRPFRAYIYNRTNQAFGASGHTLRMIPSRQQIV